MKIDYNTVCQITLGIDELDDCAQHGGHDLSEEDVEYVEDRVRDVLNTLTSELKSATRVKRKVVNDV